MQRNKFGHITQLFFSPADLLGGAAEPLSVSDMIDELAKDEVPVADKELKDDDDLLAKTKEVKEEKKDGKEEDDELELEPEVELNDLDAVEDVPRKEILKKYPELFKEFPQLEKAYYREKRYAELLPTIDDAKEAIAKAENYDKFEASVISGDLDTILGAAKGADVKSFNKMVDNYLPMLGKVDQNAYYHVIGGVINTTIASMFQEADRIKNDDLKAAAVILNQFITGGSEFKPTKSFGPNKPDEKETELTTERQQFHQERFESALDELFTRTNSIVKSTIDKHIDPKDAMTSYVKNTATKAAMEELETAIGSDPRFKAVLDKLWEKAAKTGFKKDALKDIEKAWTSRAKTLLPAIISKQRSEALKGLGKRVTNEREEPVRKGPVVVGRGAAPDNSGNKTAVPKGMKTIDYLNSD